MNERNIIDRKFFADLAKEVGLNASHLEALGTMRHREIIVDGDMLDRLVEIQSKFERLEVMGDDDYRGFYIEVPRPEPEEWGDAEELIATGDMKAESCFSRIGLHAILWKPGGSMLLRVDTGIPGQSVLQTESVPALSLRIAPIVWMQNQIIYGPKRF